MFLVKYDAFQQRAIDYINEGHSVIVSAPTGAGKTVIAECVLNDCIAKSKKAVYTAPIKALSNQKYREFQEKFGDNIGILTGDVSINPSAPILIMTTEIFRNKVLGEEESLKDYLWIIFDEIHYLDDYERGTVWEESLIFLPKHMNMLALSATIPNMHQFSEWIHSIHKRTLKIVEEKARPVPLEFFYQCDNEVLNNANQLKRVGYAKKYLRPNKLNSLIKHLYDKERLPCLYFAFSRKRCEYLAEEIRHFDFLDSVEKEKISVLYSSLCERFGLVGEKSAEILLPLIKKGIAYHHAGMLPTLKEVVERLFTSRLIKVIFTTETFALGINMPARTVVFDELRKFYGYRFAPLKTRDFYQMAGRAGRRGIDTEGFVYSRINPHMIPLHDVERIIYSESEEVKSKFNLSYATILNLYEKYKERLYDIYPLSFHYFQEAKNSRRRVLDNLYSHVKLLKDMGYIENNALTERGRFASKVYGYELSLTELYAEKMLEHMSELELGILCLALVYEPRKPSRAEAKLHKPAKMLANMTLNVLNYIHRKEKKYQVRPLSKLYHFHLSACIEAWMKKEDFSKILHYAEVDEGEIIRYFRMTIQILRELLDTPASPALKERVRNTILLINRDIVDAEKQLRS